MSSEFQEAFIQHKAGCFDAARTLYERVLETNPAHFDALNLLGVLAQQTGNLHTSLALFDRSLAVDDTHPTAHVNRGQTLQKLGLYEQALDSYSIALQLQDDDGLTYFHQGVAFHCLKDSEKALKSYSKAIGLGVENAALFNNCGLIFESIKLYNDAIRCFQRAIGIQPDFVDAHLNLGHLYTQHQLFESANDCFNTALAIQSDIPYIKGIILHNKMKMCDWSNFDRDTKNILDAVMRGERACPPFPLMAMTDSLPHLRKAAETWGKDKFKVEEELPKLDLYPDHTKIRLGYFSSDFYDHATSYLMIEEFENSDTSKFETFAFSFGQQKQDAMRERLIKAFDHFLDVSELTDLQIAQLSRSHEIDIAVDLKGYTQGCRPGIFALRAAPIQINYLGYPGTMACNYMDYLIADEVVIPKESQHHYSEQIIYMTGCYQLSPKNRKVAKKIPTRIEVGLPETGFVFCCFNNNYKITPAMFDCWMQILKATPGSVLWLLEDNDIASSNLRLEAQIRGVDPDRLVFAPRVTNAEHLARHKLADLFLDTFPYNAHTTASDALFMGLPFMTMIGESFASRVAGSLLAPNNSFQFISNSIQSYADQSIKYISKIGLQISLN